MWVGYFTFENTLSVVTDSRQYVEIPVRMLAFWVKVLIGFEYVVVILEGWLIVGVMKLTSGDRGFKGLILLEAELSVKVHVRKAFVSNHLLGYHVDAFDLGLPYVRLSHILVLLCDETKTRNVSCLPIARQIDVHFLDYLRGVEWTARIIVILVCPLY